MSRKTSTEYDIQYVGFLTGHGGDAVQMLHLAHGMHRRGLRVRVIVPAVDTSIAFAERCGELGITCDRTDLIQSDMSGPKQDLRSMIRLVRTLDAPVVHFHTGNSCLPRSLMTALELERVPRAFVTLQSPYETIEPKTARARFWAFAVRRRVHTVISPSEHGSAFQRACGLPEARVCVVRNAIDTRAMASGDGSRPRVELGMTSDDPLVVFTSRMDAQKRPTDAVQMFARHVAEFPRLRLVFVGTGTESDVARRTAEELGVVDRVSFVGHRTDVADWLAAATVWILPTERENFSVAVLEALSAGCPVLSTTCPGNDEILIDEVNALTFPVGDIDAGAAALRRLLVDSALRQRLGDRGVETAEEYAVENMVDEYQRLYEVRGLLAGSASAGTASSDLGT